MSFASSFGCTTGTSSRALKPFALPSSVCVSSVPAPASRSAYVVTTSSPLVEKRLSAKPGGS